MADDIVQVIQDAREDAVSLSQFIYYPASTMVERRLAPSIHTLNYYLDYLHGLELIYSQDSGTVTVNGEEVKTVRQAINDSVDSAILGEYQTQLEVKVNGLSGNFSAQKLDTGITATSKNGTLPITQAVKNAQTISMVEYGAVGNGIVNDTAAFELLELNVTGQIIDLQGKTYKVSQTPIKNKYTNGTFSVGSEKILSSGDLKDVTKQVPLISNQNIDTHSLRYSLVRSTSTGGISSSPQGVAYDSKNERLYQCTTGAAGASDGRGYSLNVFEATTTGELTDYYRNRSESFGHQGVGVHYDSTTGDPIIWMSGNFNYTANTGNLATAYSAVRMSNEDSITNGITTFKLFSDTTSSQSVTPNISSCGRFLVAKFVEGTNARVRLFDVKRMWDNRNTITDYSKNYLYEFDVEKPSSLDLQGLACDGVYIYVLLAEYGFSENAYIHILTLQGETVDKVNIVNVGLVDAIADSPNPNLKDGVKEYEGLLVFNEAGKQSLGIVLATTYEKDVSKKNCYIYEIGSAVTTANLKGGSITTGRGLLHSASPRFKNYNFGVRALYDVNCDYWTVNAERKGILTNMGNPIFWSDGLTGGLQLVSNDSEGMSNLLLGRNDNNTEGSRIIFHKSRSGSTDSSVFVSSASSRIGTIVYNADTTTGHFEAAKITVTGDVSGSFISSAMYFKVKSSVGEDVDLVLNYGELRASVDNVLALGSASFRFKTAYLDTAPIVSSDERLKQDFRSLKAAEKTAANEIKESICLYRMRDSVIEKGDGARWHVGVKAQQIVSIMESHGLEPFEYGFICFDEWDALEADIDDEGNEIQSAREVGNKYAIRYDELSMFILASI